MSIIKDIAIECISMRKEILAHGDSRMTAADHQYVARLEASINDALGKVDIHEYIDLKVELGENRESLIRYHAQDIAQVAKTQPAAVAAKPAHRQLPDLSHLFKALSAPMIGCPTGMREEYLQRLQSFSGNPTK